MWVYFGKTETVAKEFYKEKKKMAMCFSEVFIIFPPSCLKDEKVMILETWGKYFFSVFVFLIVIYLNFVTN